MGCTEVIKQECPICVNTTCAICPDCICQATTCPTCEVCKEPDYSSYIKELDKAKLDLRNCYIQQDIIDGEYTKCRLQNTTEYTGSIEQNYTICVSERRICNNRIGNISKFIP